MSQSRTPNDPGILERARYFPRQVVSPADLSQDQSFFLDKLRRHNRLLHGWGFGFGLEIKPISDQDVKGLIDKGHLSKEIKAEDYVAYWVRVTPGYALSPLGDEVYLPRELFVNTHEEVQGALITQPGECPAGISPRTTPTRKKDTDYYLLVDPYEAQVLPVRAASNRCGDHPDQFEYSRIKDTLRLRLREKDTQDRPPYGNQDESSERLTGRDSTCAPIRNYLILGALRFIDNEVDPNVPLDKGRDQQLPLTMPSAPAPGGQTTGAGSLDKLRSFSRLRPEQQGVLRSFFESPRDIADYASKESFVRTMTDRFDRRNVDVPDTLDSVWDDARRACGL